MKVGFSHLKSFFFFFTRITQEASRPERSTCWDRCDLHSCPFPLHLDRECGDQPQTNKQKLKDTLVHRWQVLIAHIQLIFLFFFLKKKKQVKFYENKHLLHQSWGVINLTSSWASSGAFCLDLLQGSRFFVINHTFVNPTETQTVSTLSSTFRSDSHVGCERAHITLFYTPPRAVGLQPSRRLLLS